MENPRINTTGRSAPGLGMVLSFLMLSTSVLFYSCSDDNITGTDPNQNVVTSLSGPVNNLASDARFLRAIVTGDSSTYLAGSTYIGTDNIMNVNLTAPPSVYLGSIGLLFAPLGITNINVSDPSAQGNYLTLYMYDSVSTHFAGNIIRANTPDIFIPAVGNFYITYYYSDRSVTVSGTDSRIEGSDTSKYNFNLSLLTGYNIVTTRITALRTNYIEIEVISGEPSGASWYYNPFVPGTKPNRKYIN